MNSVSSLQTERDAILNRMHSRRSSYRRMLTGGTAIDDIPEAHRVDGTHIYTYDHTPANVPRNPVMRAMGAHPVLVALGVVAIIAIGPRRIIRTLASGGAAAGVLSARNNSNMDMVGRLLTMAGTYAQGRSNK